MSIPCPDEILPHRPPFLFVDEITELDPGTKRSAPGHLPVTKPSSRVTFQGDRRCPVC